MVLLLECQEGTINDVELKENVVYAVGRMPSCSILIPRDRVTVSREHARLQVTQLDPPEVLVTDSSSSGSFINYQRITEPTVARAGDVVTFGDLTFTIRLQSSPADSSDIVPNSIEEPVEPAACFKRPAAVANSDVFRRNGCGKVNRLAEDSRVSWFNLLKKSYTTWKSVYG